MVYQKNFSINMSESDYMGEIYYLLRKFKHFLRNIKVIINDQLCNALDIGFGIRLD